MKPKTTKNLLKVLAVLGLVGAAVHVLQPLGFDPLTLFDSFGGYADWVQFVAGVSGVVVIGMGLNK